MLLALYYVFKGWNGAYEDNPAIRDTIKDKKGNKASDADHDTKNDINNKANTVHYTNKAIQKFRIVTPVIWNNLSNNPLNKLQIMKCI